MIRVPPEALSKEALRGLIEEYVTRDGTDYGEREIELESRVREVEVALRKGAAVIVFDADSQRSHILPAELAPPGE